MHLEFPEYDYPKRLYDFRADHELKFENYRELEAYIYNQLHNNGLDQVKDGLSNVLYWGYYRVGYGRIRIERFRSQVSINQLKEFSDLVVNNSVSPITIRKIGLPQFSGFAFISKIMMFLNPSKYVVLDKKIMQLSDPLNPNNPLTNIQFRDKDTSIRVSQQSQKYYLQWCNICFQIAEKYSNNMIAVDVERGFFKLVEEDRLEEGKRIISSVTRELF